MSGGDRMRIAHAAPGAIGRRSGRSVSSAGRQPLTAGSLSRCEAEGV